MSAARPQFSIDDAFELSLEDAGPGPESSGVARFGPLHFERRARFEGADEDKQSRLRYQNLENNEDGAQASPEPDGGVSTSPLSEPTILQGPGIVPAPFHALHHDSCLEGTFCLPTAPHWTTCPAEILAEHPSAPPSGPLAPSAATPRAPTMPVAAGPNTL
ncbi:PREDICTED: transmembrane protein 134 isoform X5 [Galeopterus variegatus]|uniref:Transmembrane protein 134 isoform X5 n=1 Tax=Galeopterus variegatus TaxID=482537 RepID=A0ABM0QPM9_GALVR|nr:PREDICTED: transmembrane protein 134 isoform X5 [Galeopterus variegatus]